MKGSLSHELEVQLPASELWEVYSTLKLSRLLEKLLPQIVEKIDVVQGDGGAGTIIRINYPDSGAGPKYHCEKFVLIDDEKRVKEASVVEGGFLELGFRSQLFRFEIVEKDESSSIIRSTTEYETQDGFEGNASFVTTAGMEAVAEAVSKYLIENKNNANA